MQLDSTESNVDPREELIRTMEKASKRVIAHIILSSLARRIGVSGKIASSAVSAVIISFFVWLFTWLINRIAGYTITLNEAIYLGVLAIIIGISLWLIKTIEELIFVENFTYLADLPAQKKGYEEIQWWFESNFNLRPQIISMVILGLIGLISLPPLLNSFPEIKNMPGVYFGWVLMTSIIGQGAYFAFVLPTLVMVASKNKLNLYPFNPASSQAVKLASSAYGLLSLGTGIVATIVMILILTLRPWNDKTTFWIGLCWLIFVWGVTTYTFVYPHYYIAKGIQLEKNHQCDRLDRIIKTYQAQIEELTIEQIEKMQKLIELREKIAGTKNSPLDLSRLMQYFTSLVRQRLLSFSA